MLKKSTVYTAADGTTYPTFKAAKAAQDVIDRKARLDAAFVKLGYGPSADGIVRVDSSCLAASGAAILDALTLPSGRAPRAPKAKVAA
jgi:hypothetical protein